VICQGTGTGTHYYFQKSNHIWGSEIINSIKLQQYMNNDIKSLTIIQNLMKNESIIFLLENKICPEKIKWALLPKSIKISIPVQLRNTTRQIANSLILYIQGKWENVTHRVGGTDMRNISGNLDNKIMLKIVSNEFETFFFVTL
jgi:hypothetical protein